MSLGRYAGSAHRPPAGVGLTGTAVAGDRERVYLGHPDIVTRVWSVHHPSAADVDADVVQAGRIEEHQVTGPQVGAADRRGVGPLPLRVVPEGDPGRGPG